MAEFEQHLTNEQLSALLDKRLQNSEQEDAHGHLAICEQCQQQQAELRFTVALLHALPQPALPRSFALPLDISLTQEAIVTPSKAFRPLRNRAEQSRQAIWPPYLRSTLRAISTIAAVIGIVFLLSSIPFGHMEGASSASTAGAIIKPQLSHVASNANVTQEAMNRRALTQTPATGQLLSTPTPAPAYQQPQPGIQAVPSPSPVISLFDLSTFQGRASLGFLLLVLGLVGLTIFRKRKHALKTNTFH